MIDFGDVYVGAITITDSTGAPANAGSVTATITRPDRTTVAGTVTNPSAGSYRVTYTPTAAGRHAVYWQATGANASAYTDAFDVRPAESTALLSLDDAKAAVNIPASDTSQDDELRSYIEAVTDIIEQRIGPVVPRTIIETATRSPGGAVVLESIPVISVSSMTDPVTADTYAVAALNIAATSGVLTPTSGRFPAASYSVVYTAGRSGVIPARILQAARVLLQHLWRTQRGVGSRGRGDNATDDYTLGYSLPNRVVELLAADLQLPGIA